MFKFDVVVVLVLLAFGYQFYRGTRRHEPSAADTISNRIVQSNARLPDQDVLEYQDRDNNSTRIRIDRLQETVTFENCHRPNRFWSIRNSKGVVCRFSDIVEVRGGLTGGVEAGFMCIPLEPLKARRWSVATTTATLKTTLCLSRFSMLWPSSQRDRRIKPRWHSTQPF